MMGRIEGWSISTSAYDRMHGTIRYSGIKDEDIIINKYQGVWYFSIEFLNKDMGNESKHIKSFKTKKEALDYAIKYMRSHPNG